MMKSKPSIIFMGTPEFAVASIDILLKNNYNIKAVVTAPDKPAGRGKKIQYSDVKRYALDKDLKILQPTNLKSEEFISNLKELNADLFIVVAFRMLPEIVWKLPILGTFNLHASLLPDYRGAAPINHAIINGDAKTGVTSFFINEEIDKGNIILRKETEIKFDDSAGSLHDRLMILGSELVLETVKEIEAEKIEVKHQDIFNSSTIRPAPKIFKEDCRIDWNKNGLEIYNFIRGLSPYPAAWTKLSDSETSVKLFKTEFIKESQNNSNGVIYTDNKTYAKVSVKDGFIYLKELQLQGKKRMNIKDFLNGFKFQNQIRFC